MKSAGEIPNAESIRDNSLLVPIPDLSESRKLKEGYRDFPFDKENPLFKEELVDIRDYGLAGQAYYSRPNAATGSGIPEVSASLFLRKTVAEKLAGINQQLSDPAFTKFFGAPVELYVEDAARAYELQKKLYDTIFPHLIWQQNPGISDKELALKLKNLIAEPSNDESRPSPHATGGAVDVILRFKQAAPSYSQGSEVPVGHVDGDTSERVLLDYFEKKASLNTGDELAKRNRRAYYAIMTGGALGEPTGLQVNPTEWWHWSFGDQMWAKLQHQPAAVYGLAKFG